MNNAMENIALNGCDKRHKISEHIFSCPESKNCDCAELCLSRADIFTPKEAAIIWLATNMAHDDHNYRTEKWTGKKKEDIK
jgi:hypothetical protein